MRNLFILLAVVLAAGSTLSAQQVIIKERQDWNEPMTTFGIEYDEGWTLDVIGELAGVRPADDATREELAQAVLDLLGGMPAYGQKQTAEVRPAIPRWFLDGYAWLNPVSVSHSRYLDAVCAGELEPDADIGALYAFWCVYDAEWFALTGHGDYKAWLSAVMLHYPPLWQPLWDEPEWQLHSRLVVPLQTPDEPYREIDNWINCFTKHGEAFTKPKVRDVMVAELLGYTGMEMDSRFCKDPAYICPVPKAAGLGERQFLFMAALCLEYAGEIYELDPGCKEILHFRDFFIQAAYREAD